MPSTASRALATIGATALAVAGTMLATAAPAHAAEDFEWNLGAPHMNQVGGYETWTPTLTNSTGSTVEDVTVRFSITANDAPVHIELENPDDGQNDSPCELSGDERSASCEMDLPPEDNRFWLYLVQNEGSDLDPGSVGLHAEAVRGDTELASADGQLTIEHDSTLDRVQFHGVPEEVPTDRTRPNGFDWSFTVTNDTADPLLGGMVYIELSSAAPPGLELGTVKGWCNEDSKTRASCGELGTLKPGESMTIDMKLFADGTTENLAEKVTLSVSMGGSSPEEPIQFAYGETHTRAVVADKSGDDNILPVTGYGLGGYLAAGAAIIVLGAGMLFLTHRRAARREA